MGPQKSGTGAPVEEMVLNQDVRLCEMTGRFSESVSVCLRVWNLRPVHCVCNSTFAWGVFCNGRSCFPVSHGLHFESITSWFFCLFVSPWALEWGAGTCRLNSEHCFCSGKGDWKVTGLYFHLNNCIQDERSRSVWNSHHQPGQEARVWSYPIT